jgi:hypothetical protein
MRRSASFLNFDLFRVEIVSDPSCRCGAALENLNNFFLDCPIYIQARTTLIGNINRVTTCNESMIIFTNKMEGKIKLRWIHMMCMFTQFNSSYTASVNHVVTSVASAVSNCNTTGKEYKIFCNVNCKTPN